MGTVRSVLTILLLVTPELGLGQDRPVLPAAVHLDLKEVRYEPDQAAALFQDVPETSRFSRSVQGSDRAALLKGLTTYRIGFRWSPRKDRGRCRLGRLHVDVEIKIFLPDVPDTAALARLRAHEYEHRDAILGAARDLAPRLELLSGSTCDEASTLAKELIAQADLELDRVHQKINR